MLRRLGSLIWVQMRVDSVDERYVRDAQVFRPERWLDGTTHHSAASTLARRHAFGAAPRVCPGRHLATLEVKMALATPLGAFEIGYVATPDGKEPREVFSFTMAPKGPSMRLKPR
jgi:cytochrome P450